MSGLLQIVAGVLLVFFLPGYTLVNLLFPRKGELDPEYDVVYRSALGMGLSIVIAIIVGFGLNAISTEEQGYVTSGPLWGLLVGITAVFIVLGWYRGAYPSAGYIHPSLYRPVGVKGVVRDGRSEFQRKRTIERLVYERESLLLDLASYEDRTSTSNPQRRTYYRQRMEQARARIKEINRELDALGEKGVP
jgi:hypothetical protein